MSVNFFMFFGLVLLLLGGLFYMLSNKEKESTEESLFYSLFLLAGGLSFAFGFIQVAVLS